MKEGINDKVLYKIVEGNNKVTDKIAQMVKGDKPFAKTPMKNEDLLFHVRQLSGQDLMGLSQEYGQEAVMKLIYQVSQIEKRGRYGNT